MRHIILFTLSLFISQVSYAEDKTQLILKVLQQNLHSIKYAEYESTSTSWEPYQTEDDAMPYTRKNIEIDNPNDIYTKSQYYMEDTEDGSIIMCYDGKRRLRSFVDDMTYEIDSLFKGITEYRVVGIPFYHTCSRMVDFALNPTDSISLTLSEKEKTYEIDLKIYSNLQVEFSFAKPDPHLPEESRGYMEDPTGHYILTVDKESMLPTEFYRLLCHNSSHEWITNKPVFNRKIDKEFNCFDYIPEGYISQDELEKQESKPASPEDLIGKAAPQWQLMDENGRPFSMTDTKGKIVVLMFTGIGCGPCKVAIPYINSLTEKYGKDKIQVVAFECWGKKAKDIKAYKKLHNINYDMLVDGASIMPSFNLNGAVPIFYIINGEGNITNIYNGWSDSVETNMTAELDAMMSK